MTKSVWIDGTRSVRPEDIRAVSIIDGGLSPCGWLVLSDGSEVRVSLTVALEAKAARHEHLKALALADETKKPQE